MGIPAFRDVLGRMRAWWQPEPRKPSVATSSGLHVVFESEQKDNAVE